MKQILIIVAHLVLTITLNAQNTEGNYNYRIGDKVKKQVVEYTGEAEATQDMVWDLQGMEAQKATHRVSYIKAHGKDHLIAGYENGTCYYYQQANDSLLLWGFENNLTKTVYNSPVLMLHTPMNYGSHHNGLFHGYMSYCEKMFSQVFGSWQLTVDGTGILLLPNGDTLHHVSRVHLHKATVNRYYPHITTNKELKTHVDSIAPLTDDSIYAGLLTDSLKTVTDTYRWYATCYRYPILETITSTEQGLQSVSTAYYFPPEEQELLTDKENEWLRYILQAQDNNKNDRQNWNEDQENSNPTATQSPLSRCNVTVHGQAVTVSYDLTKEATVVCLISTVSGMVLIRQTQHFEAGSNYHMQFDCSGLHNGQYVLNMNANDQVTSYTISLQ